MTNDPSASLKTALTRGDAVLIIGQDHTPDLVDHVLADANELFRPTPGWSSFPEVFTSVSDSEGALSTIMSLLSSHQPTVPILEIASLPWASVVTTAVDPILSSAFLNVGSQRRVVELGPNQIAAVSGIRSGQVLQLIRAFGTPDMSGLSMTPTSAASLTEARLIRFPGVLAALPRLAGLHGHVVVGCITERDWLDSQSLLALAHALASFPPGRVFWFGPTSTEIRDILEDKAHFEERSLHDQTRAWANDDQLQRSLDPVRERVFGIDDHVLTVEHENNRIQIRLTGQEWRSINRVGSMLDDKTIANLETHSNNKHDLVSYLRRSHAGMPDWAGPGRGFIFERKTVARLINAIRDFVAARKASIHGRDAPGARRIPYVISGPPSSGKTLGLLHAAWAVRVNYRLPVLWLLPGIAGLDLVAIERVCRLLESKGARWIVLFLDSVELEEYFRLKQRLEAEGRRILVVGSESRISKSNDDEVSRDMRRFPLNHQITKTESIDFNDYLARHQITPPRLDHPRDFLRSLVAAIPEIEFGALPSLIDEFERITEEIRTATEEQTTANGWGSNILSDQLKRLFPSLSTQIEEDAGPKSRFASDPVLRDLLDLVLFCSQLERPISVDLLFKVFGTDLITKYPTFAKSFESTALVQEVELAQDGTLALTTAHQLYALWLLRGLVPSRPGQLEILRRLLLSADWREDAFPGDEPHQDYLLGILRSIGPRGEYRYLYSSRESLDRLGELIKEVREQFGFEQPKLLTLEAIILGDVSVRESVNEASAARERCRLALQLLGKAEEVLRERPPSDSRSFELQRVLTLATDIRGTLLNIKLRGEGVSSDTDLEDILSSLSEIEEDALRAQVYASTYPPLDIVCWAHRDAIDRLPHGVDPAVRIRLLETWESALDFAVEEQLEPSQFQRYNRRRVEALSRRGDIHLSEQIAKEMRHQGDFSGEVSLARLRLNVGIESAAYRQMCLAELERLLSFGSRVLGDAFAVRFMHKLWVSSHIEDKFGEGDPKLVKSSVEEWRMLEDIARARLQLADQSELPYAMFFLGWALFQLDEPREATDVLSRLERQSFGNPRRVGELAYVTTPGGDLRIYRARVVHPHAGQVRISVPELNSQVMNVRPEVETLIAPGGVRMGEFIDIALALNYRGQHARSPQDTTVSDGKKLR